MALASTFALNLGLESSAVITGLILVQFVAFPATLIWSKISAKYGDRSVINICIIVYIAIVVYSTTLSSAAEFYILAAGVGSVQGGIQACSRSLFGKLVPEEKAGEFFGFFNTFGKAGAFIGPVWNVTSALHTPLMSVTNAISGIVIVGAILQVVEINGEIITFSSILGAFAIFFAAINIFGSIRPIFCHNISNNNSHVLLC